MSGEKHKLVTGEVMLITLGLGMLVLGLWRGFKMKDWSEGTWMTIGSGIAFLGLAKFNFAERNVGSSD